MAMNTTRNWKFKVSWHKTEFENLMAMNPTQFGKK